ncbi:MAG: GIY-YIG nuclease family protein [Brevundimonas sp.]|uniref:GIY-YIG nuclease family protein n=1 Tax=Brevundimonas sp. TaxID=1871086 RepID=UPI0027342E0A|nr:GIY-YIG nuclease family protein [Brevundimonas sp.]MDP3655689.1 GIY-YIG nuclease family protein [Brevundimonas sp.]MDZ4113855.1 GIY-YIG nuclease family protein [Brevundimonas sp.]MDZ4319898.1 GIY-YIG nuclease family protein [Phenylobacterium sp.]
MAFFTYIIASRRNGTLYTGSTDNLIKRINEHREKRRDGFTAKHDVAILVWYELHDSRHAAFVREREIKEWKRVWKLEMTERNHPGWTDLFEKLF